MQDIDVPLSFTRLHTLSDVLSTSFSTPHSASNPSESAGTGLQVRQHWALIRIATH